MNILVLIVALVVGLPGAVAAVHLTVLSVAAIFYRSSRHADAQRLRFLVIVPARNEEEVIGSTIESLLKSMNDNDTLLVVADRCTDATAEIARQAGATVLEREEDEAAGRAATIAAGTRHGLGWEWDAVCTVDADSVVNDRFFEALSDAFATGVKVAQPRSEHIRQSGVLARLAEAAFAMQGVTLPRGRTRLGLGVRLRGSGMAMLREVMIEYPFTTGGVSEDMFFSLELILNNIEASHVDGGRLRSLSAPTLSSGGKQRVRWEVGRMAAARAYVPKLVRHASRTSLETALLLITPPLAVAVFLLVLAGALAAFAGAVALVIVSAVLVGVLALDVGIGLVQSRAPWQTWAALLAAPFYIAWKVVLQVAALRQVDTANEAYEPTARS